MTFSLCPDMMTRGAAQDSSLFQSLCRSSALLLQPATSPSASFLFLAEECTWAGDANVDHAQGAGDFGRGAGELPVRVLLDVLSRGAAAARRRR